MTAEPGYLFPADQLGEHPEGEAGHTGLHPPQDGPAQGRGRQAGVLTA